MTIHINKIEGSRHSVCRNDAYAVTERVQNHERLLAIIPCVDADDKTPEALRDVFLCAIDQQDAPRATEAVSAFLSRKTQPVPA